MDGFSRRTNIKKKRIIEVARQKLMLEGPKNLNMVNLALEAKVSPVSIYTYFVSKQELLKQVTKLIIEDYCLKYEQIVNDNTKDFTQKFDTIIEFELSYRRKFHKDFTTWIEDISQIELNKYQEDMMTSKIIPAMNKLIVFGKMEGFIAEKITNKAILVYMHLFEQMIKMNIDYQKDILNELRLLFLHGLGGLKNDRKIK